MLQGGCKAPSLTEKNWVYVQIEYFPKVKVWTGSAVPSRQSSWLCRYAAVPDMMPSLLMSAVNPMASRTGWGQVFPVVSS